MFLTHRDDVADHAAFRKRFGCERVLHRDDVGPDARVRRQLDGVDPLRIARTHGHPDSGHTRGNAVLLTGTVNLFTGDHLAWSRRRRALVAFRDANWYSWPETIRSMERSSIILRVGLARPRNWHRAESRARPPPAGGLHRLDEARGVSQAAAPPQAPVSARPAAAALPQAGPAPRARPASSRRTPGERRRPPSPGAAGLAAPGPRAERRLDRRLDAGRGHHGARRARRPLPLKASPLRGSRRR